MVPEDPTPRQGQEEKKMKEKLDKKNKKLSEVRTQATGSTNNDPVTETLSFCSNLSTVKFSLREIEKKLRNDPPPHSQPVDQIEYQVFVYIT